MTISVLLTKPVTVAATASAVALTLPAATAFCTSTSATLGLLQVANVTAYALNFAAVSVPGRIDGHSRQQQQEQQQQKMGSSHQKHHRHDGNKDNTYQEIYSPSQGRSLIAPAGWAFAIWGPIFAGEAVFAGVQLTAASGSALAAALPAVTAPWVAANLFQSLWCASFRPSYVHPNAAPWHKYVSVGMLGGTAFCLSQVHSAIAGTAASSSLVFVPLTMHFGWVTAATLLNLNGALAMSQGNDSTIVAVGHASAVVATALGVGVTLTQTLPVYGWTVAWALAACADGIKTRRQQQSGALNATPAIANGMRLQQTLCWLGSGLCATAAVAASSFV